MSIGRDTSYNLAAAIAQDYLATLGIIASSR